MDKNNQKSAEAQPLPPIARKSVESGLISERAVAETRRPITSVSESVNFDFTTIGAASVRKGLTQIGGNLSGNILGVYYYVDSVDASPSSKLLVVCGTAVSYLSSPSAYTTIRNVTAGYKARFTTYLNYAFMVNGVDATAIWDGTAGSFVTTGNALNAPIGKFIENYRSRVWIAGNSTYPSRIYYSSIPSSVTTPVILWDTDVATGQWIDVSPSDGEAITGLMRNRNAMLIFKPNHLYRLFSITSVDADPYFAVGTSSQESIIETKAGIFFHHASGFYNYNIYGQVQEISRPILDIVRSIPVTAYENVAGWLEMDGDHLCWYVGTCTVNGITYQNLVLRYSIAAQVWTHRTYPFKLLNGLQRQPLYNDGTVQVVVVGSDQGKTYQFNTGKTDAGATIPYSLVHSWDRLDDLLTTRKTIMQGVFVHRGGSGTRVEYQIESDVKGMDESGDWTKNVGELKQYDTGFNAMNIKGRKIRFRVSGESSGEPFLYFGYELIGVVPEFMQFS